MPEEDSVSGHLRRGTMRHVSDTEPSHDPDRSASAHLDRLRQWRGEGAEDLGLGFLTDMVKKRYTRDHGRLGEIAAAWQSVVPESLLSRTALEGLSRGVLTIRVADSATRYELDRLLRGGVEMQLKRACKAPIRRLRVQVGPVGDGKH